MSAKAVSSTTRYNVRACIRQCFMVVLINVPTMSFGLAMGWVSLVTGDDGAVLGEGVAAAALTFCAALVGMPLCARALAAGRKPPLIGVSALFVVCWALKLCGGGWWVLAARVCAGLAGAGAWMLAPLIAREMCVARARGAAVATLVLATNLGVLLMYLAALLRVSHRSVLWGCLALSAAHCLVFLLVPESPHYLWASGRVDKARESLAWLRGLEFDDPALTEELAEFSTERPRERVTSLALVREMLSDPGRRAAFVLSCVVVLGQELSGVLALLHYAERVFVVARDVTATDNTAPPAPDALGEPAAHAVLLGAAQLLASALSLYLVERVGRKRLIVWCALVTGASLGGGACALHWGGGSAGAGAQWAAAALATAVFADSAGLEPAPYAMFADMFDYEYRSCAIMLVDALTWAGNAVEVVMFPAVAAHLGLSAALALSATLTLALAAFAQWRVPETRGRATRDIYRDILGKKAQTSTPVAAPAPTVTVAIVTKL